MLTARGCRAVACALLASTTFGACGGEDGDAPPRAAREIGDPLPASHAGGVRDGTAVEHAADERGRSPDKVGVSAGSGACGLAGAEPTPSSLPQVEDTIVCLVNAERVARGVRPLRRSPRLAAASRAHAEDMFRGGYFAHDSRDGRSVLDRVRATGYVGRSGAIVGENLGWGSHSLSTPRSVVDAWMASPGHRANVLQRRFRQLGIGVTFGSPRDRSLIPAVTVAAVFGARG